MPELAWSFMPGGRFTGKGSLVAKYNKLTVGTSVHQMVNGLHQNRWVTRFELDPGHKLPVLCHDEAEVKRWIQARWDKWCRRAGLCDPADAGPNQGRPRDALGSPCQGTRCSE